MSPIASRGYIKVNEEGHNYVAPALNIAGILYISFISIYSLVLMSGILLLFLNRRTTAVRIRGLFITILAISLLHIYIAAFFIFYPLNGLFKCGTEFWVMNLVLPAAISSFQASNARLIAYAQNQVDFVGTTHRRTQEANMGRNIKSFIKWCKTNSLVKVMYLFICMGSVIELIITTFIYVYSRKFHPHTGSFDRHASPMECRRGFEWMAAVVWQFLWCWVVGLIFLLKSAKIKDIHYWACQTRIAILAGLPGTPLWLAFLYSDNTVMEKMNIWWTPAMWFTPGLIVMQLSAIITPLCDVYINKEYDRFVPNRRLLRQIVVKKSLASSRKDRDLAGNNAVFLFQLEHNIQPLFVFAATKDFTAENIQFLVEQRDFRQKWEARVARRPGTDRAGKFLPDTDRQEMYEDAAKIYFGLIDPEISRCPVNLDHRLLNDFARMFTSGHGQWPRDTLSHPLGESSATDVSRGLIREISTRSNRLRESVVAPWIRDPSPDHQSANTSFPGDSYSEAVVVNAGMGGSCTELLSHPDMPAPVAMPWLTGRNDPESIRELVDQGTAILGSRFQHLEASRNVVLTQPQIFSTLGSTERVIVPRSFDLNVFDKARRAIQWLVFTNTWRSYIESMSDVDFQQYREYVRAETSLVGQNTERRGENLRINQHFTDIEMQDLGVAGGGPPEPKKKITSSDLGVLATPTTKPVCKTCGRVDDHVHGYTFG